MSGPTSLQGLTLDEAAEIAVVRYPELAAEARAFRGGGKMSLLVARALNIYGDGGVSVGEMYSAVKRVLAEGVR